MRKTFLAATGAITLTAALAVAGPVQADDNNGDGDDTSKLSVLHAVPGLTVDVWLDGELAIDNFLPGTLAGPLTVLEGTHTIVIAGEDSTSPDNPVIGPVTVKLADESDFTAVAHLAADGTPTASLYTNDIGSSGDGKGKLTVRHVAAAPAVDVLAGGTAVIKDLSNPDEKVLTLSAGTVSASVAAAGTTEALIGPADVPVTEGKNTIVYAWGSLADDNLSVAVQAVDASTGGHNGDDDDDD